MNDQLVKAPWNDGCFFIAEAGVNHNGDVGLAKELVDAAIEAKADAVKFQTWKPGELTGKFTLKVGYLEDTTDTSESRYELSNRLALPYDDFRELKSYCDTRDILFLSTPDGFESLDFLVDELEMPYIKVGSTEVTHVQFLEAVGKKQLPVILSTGLSNLIEIEKAVAAVTRHAQPPLAILQCTSEYPAPDNEMNVLAMRTIADTFGLPVGLSDHSRGITASIMAVTMGAQLIEKHFTLDKKMQGPDHLASMEPHELAILIDSVKSVATLMGDGIKTPTESELRNMTGIRRSVVANFAIPAGTRLTSEMLTCKRPGTGILPEDLDSLVGMQTKRDLSDDEPLTWEDVE